MFDLALDKSSKLKRGNVEIMNDVRFSQGIKLRSKGACEIEECKLAVYYKLYIL